MQSAAAMIQAAHRGIRTRQQTKQLKRALGRMALLGALPGAPTRPIPPYVTS
jgi:hypothetical protein